MLKIVTISKPLHSLQRPGLDMDPVKPWQWATLAGRQDPVEVVSYPIPAAGSPEVDPLTATIMIRDTVGDPTSIREVPLRFIGAFAPSRHEWHYRPKRFYSDNPTAFIFTDERGQRDNLIEAVWRPQ